MNCNDCSGLLPHRCTCSGGPFSLSTDHARLQGELQSLTQREGLSGVLADILYADERLKQVRSRLSHDDLRTLARVMADKIDAAHNLIASRAPAAPSPAAGESVKWLREQLQDIVEDCDTGLKRDKMLHEAEVGGIKTVAENALRSSVFDSIPPAATAGYVTVPREWVDRCRTQLQDVLNNALFAQACDASAPPPPGKSNVD